MSDEKENIEMARDEGSTSPSKENEIVRLMQKYNVSRQQAENILRRDARDRRGYSMIPISKEEFDKLLEEADQSGEPMFIGRKKKAPGDKEQQDT